MVPHCRGGNGPIPAGTSSDATTPFVTIFLIYINFILMGLQ